MANSKSSLLVSLKNVADSTLVPGSALKGGALAAKLVYGRDSSLMMATRDGGYHSKPHVHDAEQLNYVVSGEIWIFVEDGGFRAVEGDFFRIPSGKVHWSWIRNDEPCTLLEVHTPPLLGDEGTLETAVGLFTDNEDRTGIEAISNNFLEYPSVDEVERRVVGNSASEAKE